MKHYIIIVLLMLSVVGNLPAAAQQPAGTTTVYIPIVSSNNIRPFGIEPSSGSLYTNTVQSQATNLGAHWVRLNTLSWREAQPTATSPINWSAPSFQRFEQEVLAANALGLQVMAIVDDHPSWATGSSKICAAILDEYHDEFAAFVRAVVAKYSQHPYYVRYWELGNEPDVDANLVSDDVPFGCWGDSNDEYYGGERYGRMLATVTPAIRAADPGAKIIFGGLLLDRPANQIGDPPDKPFNFLEGALRAGAAPYFDILAFHAYAVFYPTSSPFDFDSKASPKWSGKGGLTVGKINFLRDVMRRYGISKPIILNETGLRCLGACSAALQFEQAKANHLVRSAMRAIAEGVEAYIWYTFEGPGWQRSGLLDDNQQPRPAFLAMKAAIERLNEVRVPPQSFTGYGTDIEAYRFSGNGFVLDVLWSMDGTSRQITLPATSFIAAYTRDGTSITPTSSGGTVTLSVGFENIYLKRRP
ncbi:cellulase family glycosylhydrolase [uncultured Chloroflexus sp.]|uniref:cellulase family glycosylhydrolase n=1 Tax=uncultured Chloroflexus sp. TaxID=214040 RepID=UPI002618E087|nr:cellulase family glycosylhydrolase [uncultured Chloroflexus sp.]